MLIPMVRGDEGTARSEMNNNKFQIGSAAVPLIKKNQVVGVVVQIHFLASQLLLEEIRLVGKKVVVKIEVALTTSLRLGKEGHSMMREALLRDLNI